MGTAFNILINGKAGTVLNMGQPAIEAAIEASGMAVAELCFSEPDDMEANLVRFAKSDTPLLVGGGDGTLRSCAVSLSKKSKAFGILPFGTMNLLAKDLSIDTLQAALSKYAEGAIETAIDAGFVNDEMFLCCASIGTMPEASVFREENRSRNILVLIPQLFWFVIDHFERHKGDRIVLQIGKKMKKFRSPAAVVAANRFADSDLLSQNNFKRDNLQGGELAAYISTTRTRGSHLRFVTRLLVGDWKKDPDLVELTAKALTLWSGHNKQLVSIDGEVLELKTPLEFKLKPRGVKLLVPKDAA
ncbi:diacylglycerol kinase family protein [Asticcacaulis sp. BYS171W]|uniref:Diacylglycerol kinase family protein n=1 Tax=Asticcacaulis aquaticus TaxID=2984212 RepID=A0ABT5HSH7_9CAUL|nr:diacylglycerol kinase family protein [Asticcacaulis aquaticus]MDC7683027.1 diacylglycerol kinase family protein [Asticcacaulis aquaticus]